MPSTVRPKSQGQGLQIMLQDKYIVLKSTFFTVKKRRCSNKKELVAIEVPALGKEWVCVSFRQVHVKEQNALSWVVEGEQSSLQKLHLLTVIHMLEPRSSEAQFCPSWKH